MPVRAFDSLEDLVLLFLELPAEGLLPARTVLVRSERQAHALRAALSAAGAPGRPAPLAGTRLVGTLHAAEEVLRAAGVAFTPGEARLRPARLARLFRAGPRLEHFQADALRRHPGWGQAFASAIQDLEAAGLRPEDLPGETPQLRDVASLWARVDEEAGSSWTAARTHGEAAAVLERDPGAWPFPGPALSPVDGHEPATLARFLRAIPCNTLAPRRARPAPARWLSRVAALYGAEAAALLGGEGSAPPRPGELGRLQALLFRPDPGAALAGPSPAPWDGTVELEEHAGVGAELEATAAWVARQVLEGGLPLSRVAVLAPVGEPTARLAADRIERRGLAAHVAGGVPAISTSAGARALAVLRALSARLPPSELAAVLPFLRLAPEPVEGGRRPRTHLSHGRALELAFSLGTAGGSRARPEGVLEWASRAEARTGELEASLAAARADPGSAGREDRDLATRLADLRAVRGPLDALVAVARLLDPGVRRAGSAAEPAAGLPALWEALRALLSGAVLLPGGAGRLLGPLDGALAPSLAAPGPPPAGDEALEIVEEALLSLRVGRGRSGQPRVFVGTVASAAGLEFDAVRIVGLAEGSIPSAPREDPVLPAELRAAIEARTGAPLLPSAEDRVTAQLQAFRAAVVSARRRVSLSAPRVDLSRTEREPAALLVEVTAALGRPHRATGAPAAPAPDPQALRRDAFEPARERALAFRRDHPLSESDWLARVADAAPGRPPELPPAWRGEAALDLDRVIPPSPPLAPLGARDGVLGPGGPFPVVPGLGPEKPISASALGDLLTCPRRFLLSRVLDWKEPAQAPTLRELDPRSFGSLVHRAHEAVYREHGAAIVGHQGTLTHWQAVAREVADRTFDAFLLELPLLGAKVREKQRERLHRAVAAFLEHDWSVGPGRRFVDVERAFGTEAALPLQAAGRTLHVRGYIDRLDATPAHTVVRDLKTGRPHPRSGDEKGPVPQVDVQIGLYQRVAVELSGAWGLPPRAVGAYTYADGRGEVTERRFEADVLALQSATTRWLALAVDLLAAHRFPATPDPSDCAYCPFAPLCGREEPARAAAGLGTGGDPVLRAFGALKRGEDP